MIRPLRTASSNYMPDCTFSPCLIFVNVNKFESSTLEIFFSRDRQ